MIQKLRRSFVRNTMIAAALVLVVLMGLVNLLNYVQRDSADKAILSILAENGGHLPADAPGLKGGRSRRLSTQDIYGASYFVVALDPEGSLLYLDTSHAPWVTDDSALLTAQTLRDAGKSTGTYNEMKFITAENGADVMYIFLAWSQNMAAMRSFFANSLIVTAAGLVVLFFLAWALSGKAVRPIAESYEKQKSFITNAGHELKTPLAVIQSCTEVIEIENGESQWTQSIHGQVERLSTLTGELIALSRMDEGTANPELAELDVSGTVSKALAPFALLAEQKGLTFTAEIAPDIQLKSNRESLEKLCAILADNAVKYTSPGGDIRFTLVREGGHMVCLRSENPAAGLTAGKQERLFDRFYRGDESRGGDQPGYGLGLPLARSLAESLGGSVTAHSPDGKRLIFTVRLT